MKANDPLPDAWSNSVILYAERRDEEERKHRRDCECGDCLKEDEPELGNGAEPIKNYPEDDPREDR